MIQTILFQLSILMVLVTVIYTFAKKYISSFLMNTLNEMTKLATFTKDLF